MVTFILIIKSTSRCRLYISCCSSEESCQCTQHASTHASHVLEITHLSTQKYTDRGRCHKHRQQNTANINLYYIYQL